MARKIPSKASSDKMHTSAALWTSLKERSEKRRSERIEALKRAEEAAQPGRRTKQAASLAAGTNEKPVGNVFTDVITIGSTEWASRIVSLAQAWRTYPGFTVLRKRPIPDRGLGIRAALRIFNQAAKGGRSATDIARDIDTIRASLGPWRDADEGPCQSDTEVGLWIFFRQLDRFFDGDSWSPPPRQRSTAPRDAIAAPAAVVELPGTSPRKDTRQPACQSPLSGEHTIRGRPRPPLLAGSIYLQDAAVKYGVPLPTLRRYCRFPKDRDPNPDWRTEDLSKMVYVNEEALREILRRRGRF